MNLYYIKVTFLKKYYKLEGINETELRNTYSGNGLKKFIYKKDIFILVKNDFENNLNKSKSWENILIINKDSNEITIKTRNLIKEFT
jgi:hypothetical protein